MPMNHTNKFNNNTTTTATMTSSSSTSHGTGGGGDESQIIRNTDVLCGRGKVDHGTLQLHVYM